jgi:hypothetical protein
MAATAAACQALWLRRFFFEIKLWLRSLLSELTGREPGVVKLYIIAPILKHVWACNPCGLMLTIFSS